MTPKPTRTRGGSLGTSCDADLLAGLWQEAPFARLPPDAPPELVQYVHDIENPNRVYAIHLASRRHDFQLWVERYVLQLRVGCGQSSCTTPTCFTCRKRLAGQVPIRRYNSTSARTLAVYLASQDNPHDGLCPYIRLPREAPTTSGTLIFSARPPSTSRNSFNKKATVRTPSSLPKEPFNQDSNRSSPSPYTSPRQSAPEPRTENPRQDNGHVQVPPKASNSPEKPSISVTEKQVGKDHRSFAANLFGTVAFKMFEWLTPRGIDSISQQITSLDGDLHARTDTSSDPDQTASRSTSPSMQSAQAGLDVASGAVTPGTDHSCNPEQDGHSQAPFQDETSVEPRKVSVEQQAPVPEELPISSKPDHLISTENPGNPVVKNHYHSSPSSPRVNIIRQEISAKSPKTEAAVIALSIPENLAGPPVLQGPKSSPLYSAVIGQTSQQISGKERREESHIDPPRERVKEEHVDDEVTKSMISASLPQQSLPQSLSRLNVEIIDFICNVFQEDGTTERSFFLRNVPEVAYPNPQNPSKVLVRKSKHRSASSREQWKAFNEQTIFNVLSDPQAVLQSFTNNGRLYDSHTLWYCLHRMAQVSPTLVYHSLWIAAGSLFDASSYLQQQPKIKTGPRRNMNPKLSISEAGHLMSVCMHALVAAAPCAPDSRSLYEMSRIRSNGLALANGGSAARQPPSRCLNYNDVFSDDLMIRLARRLFLSITSHIYMKKPTTRKGKARRSTLSIEILRPLLSQLDFLGTGSTSILDFPENEKLLHETRVPTILLDWARTILLIEWDGQPDFSTDGPFAGALSFIEALHKNRNVLLLGDNQFRVDFLSDRLDSIQLPVDWLAFKSTHYRRHILDYPYIFSPDTLVSFFRSINFARMSRMFEESSSLKTRMNAIVDPGSLITNPHHKTVLQDLLDTASSKYLILEIGRDNVVRDAFDQLWRREKRELLRPLKVHLGESGGEEGFDSGGVQQEFFRLAVSECLDPTYGAFTVDEMTRMAWFSPGSLTEDWKYELVGLLVSLAIYNGLTLPVTFPKALYRKLLGNAVEELHHIADGWSDLAKGLTSLLEWKEEDGSIEDVFSRTYEFSVSAFGHNVTREMSSGIDWPKAAAGSGDTVPPHVTNPADAPLVTSMNRDAYVSDYIRYLTDVSIRSQYLAFERGFRACLDKKSLSLLSPSTLQSLVEGIQEIDIPDLRRHARYVGWDASHHTIRDFWSIVKRYDLSMKRRLLEFVTSSDRIPVGGMKNLQFVIQKNGEEESNGGHLPTAYTCYGTLLLPEYRNKELLKERLAMALENCQGFGFA